MARIETEVDIFIEDYLDEISDEVLAKEVRRRDMDIEPEALVSALHDARDALHRGKRNEALCILDRVLCPKWHSASECRQDYDRAMGRSEEAPS